MVRLGGIIEDLGPGVGNIRGEDNILYFFNRKSRAPGTRFRSLKIGVEVSFTPSTNERGPRADEVKAK